MAELGEELRRERVRRNLTFKDIEQVLHIKTTYLEAIEDGNYAVIPDVYTLKVLFAIMEITLALMEIA